MVVLSSWGKAGLLLPLDDSGDNAWAKKELNSDAEGNPLDADAGEEEAEPAAGVEDLLEMSDISNDNGTGVVNEGGDDDNVEKAGRGVEQGTRGWTQRGGWWEGWGGDWREGRRATCH